MLFVAGLAWLYFSRGAVRRSRKARVAHAAAAASRHEDPVAFVREVRKPSGALIPVSRALGHERPERNGAIEILARVTRSIRALTVLAPGRFELRVEPVVDESVGMRARNDEDRSAVTAVAAARAAARHAKLASEREAPAPPCASRDVTGYFVNEHRIWSSHHRLIRSFLQIE